MNKRRQNFENIAWFLDLFKRKTLDMDPPFQRRSVWNQKYREDFIDTILLDYPAPAIFLFASITEAGATSYQLVDGKQRLEAIFDFVSGKFAVGESSAISRLSGVYFERLSREEKLAFYQYDFSVEYLPTNNEQVINGIFDRLNRNVAKLTPQELRHARFSGRFITAAEALPEWMESQLGRNFPRITDSSRSQMKDVEVVSTLLLFLEEGVKGYSTLTLDEAFSKRDDSWEKETSVVEEFRTTVQGLAALNRHAGGELATSRLRNQADFYSLFAGYTELARISELPDKPEVAAKRLMDFVSGIDVMPSNLAIAQVCMDYYEAARSASNDPGPRRSRIDIIKSVIRGEYEAAGRHHGGDQ